MLHRLIISDNHIAFNALAAEFSYPLMYRFPPYIGSLFLLRNLKIYNFIIKIIDAAI